MVNGWWIVDGHDITAMSKSKKSKAGSEQAKVVHYYYALTSYIAHHSPTFWYICWALFVTSCNLKPVLKLTVAFYSSKSSPTHALVGKATMDKTNFLTGFTWKWGFFINQSKGQQHPQVLEQDSAKGISKKQCLLAEKMQNQHQRTVLTSTAVTSNNYIAIASNLASPIPLHITTAPLLAPNQTQGQKPNMTHWLQPQTQKEWYCMRLPNTMMTTFIMHCQSAGYCWKTNTKLAYNIPTPVTPGPNPRISKRQRTQ